jgi:hypothetical protein
MQNGVMPGWRWKADNCTKINSGRDDATFCVRFICQYSTSLRCDFQIDIITDIQQGIENSVETFLVPAIYCQIVVIHGVIKLAKEHTPYTYTLGGVHIGQQIVHKQAILA